MDLPTVIVLAAGRGSRFDGAQHKLAEPMHGVSVLAHTLHNAIASRLPVLVVTTARLATEARRLVATRDLVLLPEQEALAAGQGMGISIAAGVAARPQSPGWLILPADMPLVTADTLNAVAHALSQHAVAYAQHGGQRGHPVGFAAELYSELVQLQGDEGARRLLARYPAVGVEVEDAGTLIDIDTEADLAIVRALHARRMVQPLPSAE